MILPISVTRGAAADEDEAAAETVLDGVFVRLVPVMVMVPGAELEDSFEESRAAHEALKPVALVQVLPSVLFLRRR